MTARELVIRTRAVALWATVLLVALVVVTASPAGSHRLAAQEPEDPVRLLPFQRIGQTTVLDAANGHVVTFGGWNGQRLFNNVWVLDPTPGEETWTRLQPDGSPPAARTQHAAVYDVANSRMIVFGGRARLLDRNDVWALDLTPGAEAWAEITPDGEGPEPRRLHTAVYDAANGRMVAFGGGGRDGLAQDIWALDLAPGGETWSKLNPTGPGPEPRVQHSAVYDAPGGRMVVFGGAAPGAALADVWALDLTSGAEAWVQLSAGGTAPGARRAHGATYLADPGAMLVFGGLGEGGFLAEVWLLNLAAGSESWSQSAPSGAGPSPRVWPSVTPDPVGGRAVIVFGGMGPHAAGGGSHWRLRSEPPTWLPFAPSVNRRGPRQPVPPLAGEGEGSPETLSNGSSDLNVKLFVEDAAAHVPVNIVGGIGPAGNTQLYVVTKLHTTSAAYASNVQVTLVVGGDVLGDQVKIGLKSGTANEPDEWLDPVVPSSGRYRISGLELTHKSDGSYERSVVHRIMVTRNVPIQEVDLTTNVCVAGNCWDDEGTVQTLSRVHSMIVTNRRLLFEHYAGGGEVVDLLQRLFKVTQGNIYSNPVGMVAYVDRYLTLPRTWDNTQVDYSSEANANRVANAIDVWLDDHALDQQPRPGYLVIVGDDNIVPFYRKHDYPDEDYYQVPDTEDLYPTVGNYDPVLNAVVSHSYFLTDNPYADTSATPDWEQGNVELAIGRIVGASASDMDLFIRNSAHFPDRHERFVTVSASTADMTQLGEDNDVLDVADMLGYSTTARHVESDPTKSEIVPLMTNGFPVMASGSHGEVIGLVAPGGAGPDWSDEWILDEEVDDYDAGGMISQSRPFYQLLACRVGMSYNTQGPYGSFVYALVHHSASGILASAGLSHAPTPQGGPIGPDETLTIGFWDMASRSSNSTMPLGYALRQAKRAYDLGSYAEDKKVVQTYTYFGLPWTRIRSHRTRTARVQSEPGRGAAPELAIRRPDTWSAPRSVAQAHTYVVTSTVVATSYAITQTLEGYDLIQVQGMRQAAGKDEPVLPVGRVDLMLPVSATISSVVITPTQEIVLQNLDIPSVELHTSHPDSPPSRFVDTPDGTYPDHMMRFNESVLDTFRLARVRVIPVTYDAATDEATLYRNVTVRVTYETPVSVALTRFTTDELQYVTGDPVRATATLVNASDAPVALNALLMIYDAQLQRVGAQQSDVFQVLAGASRDLEMEWSGQLENGAYLVRIVIREGAEVVAGASEQINVAAGEISAVTAPTSLTAGEVGTFEVTFANLRASGSVAAVGLAIHDAQDRLVAQLEPQAVAVAGGASATVSFEWVPPRASEGRHVAAATVTAGGQIYGPETAAFEVRAPEGIWVYQPIGYKNGD